MEAKLYPALHGFEHIKRYWDKHANMVVAKILPGEFYVTKNNELIGTVLGSCISACIWDSVMGIGGMNHFMLPIKNDTHGASGWENNGSYTCRYGNWAMEYLINEILKNGGNRNNIKCKIFGGGKIISTITDVGANNISFVKTFIENEGLDIVSEDVGGNCPRKVLFDPNNGRARIKRLRSLNNETIQQREIEYVKDIKAHEQDSDIELF